MAELLRIKEEYKSDANARAASGNILFSPPPLSSSANRILKSEAVQNHRDLISEEGWKLVVARFVV
ncbi:hypothetical protein DPMN_090980 [Dreissena polymorpha]|uniref:Uncharacterized protein n=1 Tax=Dreissena polymorpha TaxID=45954 RepID=A0A9D4KZ28_DREPO|nr:hypothetical protein DPMN_090980 [Dreissena polymorpha]